MDNIRKYLVTQLEATGSVQQFDLAETLLVMYDAGIITATEDDNGEPLFMYNASSSSEQIEIAEVIHDTIRNADNVIWNSYVYKEEN